jgi:N-acyl-D-amino-acid deacylase
MHTTNQFIHHLRCGAVFLLAMIMAHPLHAAEMAPGREEARHAEQPLPETGTADPNLTSFDDLMRSFLREHEIPGAALAVAKDGHVVYARGFGYADLERQQPVEPGSLFRIASVSKPVTAMAVMRLVEQGKLDLDGSVFEQLPHAPHLPVGHQPDPRLQSITVRQLLQHTGGWDRDISVDPMFQSVAIAASLQSAPPAEPDDIVRFMMGWPLDFDPGTRHAYSNYGYCLLGRLLEHATGSTYEEHVRRDLLQPLGIRSMRIGCTLEHQRSEGEVRYYLPRDRFALAVVGDQPGVKVPRPYGAWYLEAMDSHGGWIASAIDLVRFGSAVAHWEQSRLLSAESIRAIDAPPPGTVGHDEQGQPKAVYYGLGWMVRHVNESGGVNRWHNGRFDGASSLLVLRHDGLCWAVLFNTSATPDGDAPAGKIDSLLHRAADAVTHWPEPAAEAHN